MDEATEKKKNSRRDFLKIGGLIGVAAQAVAIPALVYKEGQSRETHTGWEPFYGDETTQFFNRKPFELKGSPISPAISKCGTAAVSSSGSRTQVASSLFRSEAW